MRTQIGVVVVENRNAVFAFGFSLSVTLCDGCIAMKGRTFLFALMTIRLMQLCALTKGGARSLALFCASGAGTTHDRQEQDRANAPL